MRNCKMCNKETKNVLFCSRKCANTYKNINNHPTKGKGKGTPFCQKCKTNHVPSYGYKLCTDCSKNRFIFSTDPSKKELREKYRHSKHSTGMQSYIRTHARLIFFKSKNQVVSCANCGYDKHVEVCHKIPITDFNEESKLSQINSLENLVGLCPNCHWELDNYLLQINM